MSLKKSIGFLCQLGRGDTFLLNFGQNEQPEELDNLNDQVQNNSRPTSPNGHDENVETQSNVSEHITY